MGGPPRVYPYIKRERPAPPSRCAYCGGPWAAVHSCPSCGAPMERNGILSCSGPSAYREATDFRLRMAAMLGLPAHYLTNADRADAHDSADRA
jgi:predicted amidophosphoribosyltransferase